MNAYRKLLGIAAERPDHYRLLGVDRGEADPQVIERAADRQAVYLRTVGTSEAQGLLNEVAAARLCLLDPARRAVYNRTLIDPPGPCRIDQQRWARQLPDQRVPLAPPSPPKPSPPAPITAEVMPEPPPVATPSRTAPKPRPTYRLQTASTPLSPAGRVLGWSVVSLVGLVVLAASIAALVGRSETLRRQRALNGAVDASKEIIAALPAESLQYAGIRQSGRCKFLDGEVEWTDSGAIAALRFATPEGNQFDLMLFRADNMGPEWRLRGVYPRQL